VALFKSGEYRGNKAVQQREDLLTLFADGLRLIDYKGPKRVPGRESLQYLVRRVGQPRWLLLDGKEICPFLLGLAYGLPAAHPSATAATEAMRAELVGADPIPAGELDAADERAQADAEHADRALSAARSSS
jgi:hypothetical protein